MERLTEQIQQLLWTLNDDTVQAVKGPRQGSRPLEPKVKGCSEYPLTFKGEV